MTTHDHTMPLPQHVCNGQRALWHGT